VQLERAVTGSRRAGAVDHRDPALAHLDPRRPVAADQQPGQARERGLVSHAEEARGLDGGEPGQGAGRLGLVPEQLARLRRRHASVGAGRDVGGLAGAREGAGQDTVEGHAHAAERGGHPDVLASPRVGQRPLAVARPAGRIRVAGVGVAHEDEAHGDYYRTTSGGWREQGPARAEWPRTTPPGSTLTSDVIGSPSW
jgi:hypothetical protein